MDEQKQREIASKGGSASGGNFANDPEDEIRKFHWLHSQHLISADQLQRIITTIRDADTHDQDSFDEPSPPRQ